MKFINQQKPNFSIEITPLIDIVFLLVIFFVVTSKVGDSQFLNLDLPKTESFEYNVVESNGIYNISNIKELEQAIFELDNQSTKIILSAEATSLHIWIVGIMDILNKNGFNEVQIRTIEK